MSRTYHKSKPPGFEWWSKRPMSGWTNSHRSKTTNKQILHGIERARSKEEMEKELTEFSPDDKQNV